MVLANLLSPRAALSTTESTNGIADTSVYQAKGNKKKQRHAKTLSVEIAPLFVPECSFLADHSPALNTHAVQDDCI